jgi:O-acetyl-ADP-ribose deacetylase (regulator of RNase III)
MGLDDEITELNKKIRSNVSKDIVESADRATKTNRDFSFFPMWGSGQFLFELIEGLKDEGLAGQARHYLDHKMRLRVVLARGGLNPDAIDVRLRRLDERVRQEREQGIPASPRPVHGWRARREPTDHHVDIVYADLASRSLLASTEFGEGRRAVVSPDDVLLSAGGGAALASLEKAGKTELLSEIAKFESVPHREVAVTSGLNLPVNYIFHAATVALKPDGSSDTTAEDVQLTMVSALRAALALSVRTLFVPLIGAGTEALMASASLAAILGAFTDFIQGASQNTLRLVVVIRQEAELSRTEAGEILKRDLPNFSLARVPIATV